MAKNLKTGTTVYQVRGDPTKGYILYQGVVVACDTHNICEVHWLKPNTELTGLSTKEFTCDLYRTPHRASLAYLRRVKHNLAIQEYLVN